MPESAAAFPYRIKNLEDRQTRQQEWVSRVDQGVTQHAVTIAAHEERLDGHDEAINRLADTVNKGVWALVAFSFTVAASAVGLAISLGGGP
jgi:uncharacterized coiled-coil protein SlyX